MTSPMNKAPSVPAMATSQASVIIVQGRASFGMGSPLGSASAYDLQPLEEQGKNVAEGLLLEPAQCQDPIRSRQLTFTADDAGQARGAVSPW
jgi:hypothetical protein